MTIPQPSLPDPHTQRRNPFSRGSGKKSSTGKIGRSTGLPEDEPETDTRPALMRRSASKKQQGINWDTDLIDYANETIARLKRTYPNEPGVASLAALVDTAVREKITEWEKRYNDGEAFPPLV